MKYNNKSSQLSTQIIQKIQRLKEHMNTLDTDEMWTNIKNTMEEPTTVSPGKSKQTEEKRLDDQRNLTAHGRKRATKNEEEYNRINKKMKR